MNHEQADIWDYYERGHKVVIPTNVGWDPKTRRNNMGAGLALQAARRWPWLPEWYGSYCRLWITRWRPESVIRTVPVVELDRLIFFPVKPLLHFGDPERSWNQRAKPDTIRVSLTQLTRHHGRIALPFPGCGNGQLKPLEVLPLLQLFLEDERFTVCDWEWPLVALDKQLGLNAVVDGLGMLDAALKGAGLAVRDGMLVRSDG